MGRLGSLPKALMAYLILNAVQAPDVGQPEIL